MRAITRSVGLPSSTVSDYLVRADAVGLGWPLPEGLDEPQLQAQLLNPARGQPEAPLADGGGLCPPESGPGQAVDRGATAERLRVEQLPGVLAGAVEAKRETETQKAQRIIGEELPRRRWSEADREQRRKTEAAKVQIAARRRRERVQTLDWIAQRLRMGCRHTLANCLKKARNCQ